MTKSTYDRLVEESDRQRRVEQTEYAPLKYTPQTYDNAYFLLRKSPTIINPVPPEVCGWCGGKQYNCYKCGYEHPSRKFDNQELW